MKQKEKRILSWVLVLLLVFSLIPFDRNNVYAAVIEKDGWEVYWEASDIGSGKDGEVFGNFKVIDPDGKVAIDANKKTFKGMSFDTRLKLGGKGSAEKIALQFKAPMEGTLTVYAISGSSGDLTRYLILEDENGNKENNDPLDGKNLTECTWELETGGTYYLYSSAGVNLYYISYESQVNGNAPVIKENSVQVRMPNQSKNEKQTITGSVFSAKTTDNATAFVTWEIEKQGSTDSKIQVEYRDQNDNWKVAAVLDSKATNYEHDLLEVPSGDLQYRVSGLGNLNSPLVYSNIYQWEQPRKAWEEVTDPQINIAINSEDDQKIDVEWKMELGREGADSFYISLLNAQREELANQIITEKEAKGENSGVVSFFLDASGTYIISVKAGRESETDKRIEETYTFKMPLKAPENIYVQGQGSKKVLVKWDKAAEVDYYEVYTKALNEEFILQKKVDSVENTCILTELTDKQTYMIRVASIREKEDGTKETKFAEVEKYITGQEEREFLSVPVGSGAKGTAAGDFYGENAKITIEATGGKIADSEDGFIYYYTELKPEDNFIMEAIFTVSEINVEGTTNNQSGFGIIAIDTIEGKNNSNGRYFNSAGAVTAKFKKLDTASGASTSFDNLAGLRVVTGYKDLKADVSSSDRVLSNIDSAFFYPETNSSTKMYEVGDAYHLILRRSNTGYHGILKSEDGSEVEKIFYYPEGDNYIDPLLVQDPEHIYVGFMASRYIKIEVTDMSLTVLSKEEDEPRQNPPKQYTIPKIDIYSANTIGTSEYPFEYRANIAGDLVVKDKQGTIIFSESMEANEYVEQLFTLEKGENNFTCILTPSREEKLESYEAIEKVLKVTYQSYGTPEETIIVSPEGTSKGTGSENRPLDIKTAFQYVQPGQTVLLKDGIYQLENAIIAQRGQNGTAEKPITITAETVGNVILDLSDSSGGLSVNGDYWHIYGLNICNASFGVKPVQVQGNYNKIELCKIYDNGDSGLQISGSSLEPKSKWPSYNEIINCDAYDNADYKGNDADGFAAKLTVGEGNKFIGCISHHNIDDGWDLYAKSTTGSIGTVTIENCVTYANGFLSDHARLKGQLLADDKGEGNGFKLGGESMPGAHLLINSISFGNGAKGVTSNSGPDCRIQNVTIYDNSVFEKKEPAENFSLYTNTASFTNYKVDGVISILPSLKKADKLEGKGQNSLLSENNYIFNGVKSVNSKGEEASVDWFENVDTSILPTRNKDGSINMNGLLKLKEDPNIPANAGARLEAIVSEPPVVPNAIIDKEIKEEETSASKKSGKEDKKEVAIKAVITELTQTEVAYMKQAVERLFSAEASVINVEKSENGILIAVDTRDIIFQKTDHTLATREWQQVNEKWYYFGNESKALSGWILPPDGRWYYLDKENHQMKTGWIQTADGTWYLLDGKNGDMKTGWQQTEDKKWYYLGKDGGCFIQTTTPDGYLVDENGAWIK